MIRKDIALALGLTAAAIASPADAGDWNYGAGGIKDQGMVAVPVPAPVPIQEHFRWYVRGDAGGGMRAGGGVTQSGAQFGLSDGIAPATPVTMPNSWFTNDFDTFLTAGIGAGLYMTPHWRGDITIDARTPATAKAAGNYSYTQYQLTPLPITATGNTVYGSVDDQTRVRDTFVLANVYYDFGDRGSGWTPYVGVGVGTAVRSADRRITASETVVNNLTGVTATTRTIDGHGKTHQAAPAAALTAGASYAISPSVVLDLNYRFTYVGAVDFNAKLSNGSTSKMTVDDTQEHALRAGVRFNVW